MKPKQMQQQTGGPLGVGRTLHWYATQGTVDMAMRGPEPRRVQIGSEPQALIADLNRTAIMVIEMQNDFCARDRWVDHLGQDYTPDRAPIAPSSAADAGAAEGQLGGGGGRRAGARTGRHLRRQAPDRRLPGHGARGGAVTPRCPPATGFSVVAAPGSDRALVDFAQSLEEPRDEQ